MAVSDEAGNYGGYLNCTCILKEGNITVSSRSYGPGGTYENGATFASELRKGDVVTLSADTGNTYEATGGLPVVQTVANSDTKVFGIIVGEPVWVAMPTSSQSTWATQLSGKYYRIAKVEVWCGITAIRSAVLTSTGTTSIVPGVLTTLSVDVSESTTNHVLTLTDDTTAGVGFCPLTYATGAGTFTVLVGITSLGTAIT